MDQPYLFSSIANLPQGIIIVTVRHAVFYVDTADNKSDSYYFAL